MTCKDCFLTKEEYNQLVWVSLRHLIEQGKISKIRMVKPAFYKPKMRWTGKQVITTIIKNITHLETGKDEQNTPGLNITSKAKLKESMWGRLGEGEGQVIIRNNELVTGVLDKSQLGDAEFGLTHAFYEVYGSVKCGFFLTAIARCLTLFL